MIASNAPQVRPTVMVDMLLELNRRLLDDPTLCFRKPATEGWIAVLQLCNAKQAKEVSEALTSSIDQPLSSLSLSLEHRHGWSDCPGPLSLTSADPNDCFGLLSSFLFGRIG